MPRQLRSLSLALRVGCALGWLLAGTPSRAAATGAPRDPNGHSDLQRCGGAVATQPASQAPPGCLRFGTLEYDDAFAQVVEREAITVRPSGYDATLAHTARWDRGLGALLVAVDPNGLVTSTTRDGLGRLTSVTPPNVDGCAGLRPSTRITYELTADPASQPLSRVRSVTELSCDGALGSDVIESIAYVDGLGRTRAALSTGDGTHAWVRSGLTTFDKPGTPRRGYQADFYDGDANALSAVLALPDGTPYTVSRYDAFGRTRGVIAEDGSVAWTSFHSLSSDVCDPLDNDPSSEHYRTCTTSRTDGHGRVVDQVLRTRHPGTGQPETHRMWTYYRADGAVVALARARSEEARPPAPLPSASGPYVLRTFHFDSQGRRLSSDDPDSDDPTNPDESSNSWRYLFNRVGDLVAVRDPRGCGQNFYYDLGGRLVGEQYVSCLEAQSARRETPVHTSRLSGVVSNDLTDTGLLDVVYHFDAPPSWAYGRLPSGRAGVLGRATGVTDRAQRSAVAYDARGNVTWTARQVALLSDPLELVQDPLGVTLKEVQGAVTQRVKYDALHTYERRATFDHAGRPRATVLPLDPDRAGLPLSHPAPGGLVTYNRRGLPSQMAAFSNCDVSDPSDTWVDDVSQLGCSGGDVHTIVDGVDYLRDGQVAEVRYGDDLAGRSPTVSRTSYDVRRRPIRRTTARDPGSATEGLAAVTRVVDERLVWDAASNLVARLDDRDPAEWPAGYRPQSVHLRHDALYRVVGAEYDYTQEGGARTPSDDATDWRDNYGMSSTRDPMRPRAAGMLPSAVPDRVASQTWTYDFLANSTDSGDDAGQFHERSVGDIVNGVDLGPGFRPSALYFASNVDVDATGGGATSGRQGYVAMEYGASGNVTGMTARAACGGSQCRAPPLPEVAEEVCVEGRACTPGVSTQVVAAALEEQIDSLRATLNAIPTPCPVPSLTCDQVDDLRAMIDEVVARRARLVIGAIHDPSELVTLLEEVIGIVEAFIGVLQGSCADTGTCDALATVSDRLDQLRHRMEPLQECSEGSDCTGLEARLLRGALDACDCAAERQTVLRWDELGRLVEARRYDRVPDGQWLLGARLRYRYDAANQRMVKQVLEPEGCVTVPGAVPVPCDRVALYPYPGEFERRGLRTGQFVYEADVNGDTETQYQVAGARWVQQHDAGGASFDAGERLVVGLTDLIQTTGAAFDVRTGVLLEASTYYPNGARETYRIADSADEWVGAEPMGFTGKEADEEVGLVYFGERWLLPRLGRWASADPLEIHAVGGGEVLNSYHYVGGNLFAARDPLGLRCGDNESCPTEAQTADMSLPDGSAGDGEGTGGRGQDGETTGGELAMGLQNVAARQADQELDAHRTRQDVTASQGTGAYRGAVGALVGMVVAASLAHPVGAVVAFAAEREFNEGVPSRASTDEGREAEDDAAAVAGPLVHLGVGLGAGAAAAAETSAAAAGRAASRAITTLDSSTIRFSQRSVGRTFSDQTPLRDVIAGLRGGRIAPDSIPPIRVTERGGQLFTLDNRRLLVFQEAGIAIRTVRATADEVAAEAWKFTTRNGGASIRVRGGGL